MESKKYHEDLLHIRSMMERSSKFISLSGLSGAFAGVVALWGAAYAYFLFEKNGIDYLDGRRNIYSPEIVDQLLVVAILVLLFAIVGGYFFTRNKSKKQGKKMWDATSKRLLINFAAPLATGGIVCLALLYHHLFPLIAPATLIFYGLALVNAGNFTFTDVKFLGYLEIILGIISLFFLGWGLITWAIGFGVLHIIYGIIMHKKYK
ncbi:hypothetical protein [Chryseobacterium sp.]|uniref:hypothetical protein n=1 Tax=Chryseobacterium sp. TaxID=1871047 RepID=UPI00388F2711